MIPNERKVPIMSIKLKNEAAKNIFVSKKSLKILKVQSESLIPEKVMKSCKSKDRQHTEQHYSHLTFFILYQIVELMIMESCFDCHKKYNYA
jgi:hypothetical protein